LRIKHVLSLKKLILL